MLDLGILKAKQVISNIHFRKHTEQKINAQIYFYGKAVILGSFFKMTS